MRKRSHKCALTKPVDNAQLLTLPELPQPWNPIAVFGRVAPLELEIGSGRGLFICNAAKTTPEHDFLGIEIAKKYASHCASLIAKKGLANAVMVSADAVLVLSDKIPDFSLHAVHIYFPDPWWKRKHRKRRVVCEPVIRLVAQKLHPGGTLHFWTDVEEYYQTAIACIAKVTNLEGPFDVTETPAEHEFDYRTHFERRTRLHDQPVYRSLYTKK